MDGLLYDALSCIVTVAESIVILFLLYYYYVSVSGWRKQKEEKHFTPEKRFALITAAHNEEAVIRYHLDSLKNLNYPAELFDIYVIADNCSDSTAAIARQQGAPWIRGDESVTVTARHTGFDGIEATIATSQRDLGKVRTQLAGHFQLENLATAVAAVETFGQAAGLPIPDAAFTRGLAEACWPGRFHVVCRQPIVIVDGAHNPDAARSLKATLRQTRFTGPVALVAGFCDDKDIVAFMRILASRVRRGWAVTTPSARTRPAAETAEAMRHAGMAADAAANLAEALTAAEAWAEAEQGLVVVCGSLFLAGAALAHYGVFPWPVPRRADPNEQLKPHAQPSEVKR